MQLSSCRFLDEGDRVAPEQTYGELSKGIEMEEDGVVMVYLDCVVEQLGGM